MNLVLADVLRAEAIRRTVEELREILHRVDVGSDNALSVVAALKLIENQLSKMGHGDLLVTQNLHE